MKNIEMIARVGADTLTVGKCTSAQARILVKNNHAAWQDGRILLPLDPKLLEVAVNHPKGPLDDENVSEKELERRMAWLGSLVHAVAVTRAERGASDADRIAGLHIPLEHAMELVPSDSASEQDPWSDDPSDLAEWYGEGAPAPAAGDDADWFNDLSLEQADHFGSLWQSAPDLSDVFGVHPPSDRTDVLPPIDPSAIREALARIDGGEDGPSDTAVTSSPPFHRARFERTAILSGGRPVDRASLVRELAEKVFGLEVPEPQDGREVYRLSYPVEVQPKASPDEDHS